MAKQNIFARSKTMDLSQGNIFSQLMIFALPLLLGQIFQTLYNSVDSIVIGNFESAEALAAVTAGSTISMIVSGFFNGMSAGTSAILSRFFGAKDLKKLDEAIHTTALFGLILGVALAGLGVLFTPALLHLTGCPDDVFEMAVVYLRIYLIGVLFTSVYNIGAGVLRSIGNSQSPFIYLVISSVLNIGLDILFVAVFSMGVAGVAIATIIAQGISMLLVFRKMTKMDEEYRFRFRKLKINWNILGEVVKLGIPSGIQSSITSISNIFVQSYINSFSSMAIAGIGSAMRIDQFAGLPCQSLGLAMTTFIGQNLGAQKFDRAHKSVGVSTLACTIYVIVLSIPIYLFAPQLVGIFTPNAEVIEYGTRMLRTIMPVYLFMGWMGLFSGIIRGFGFSITSMICTFGGMVAARQIWLAVSLNLIDHDIQYLLYGYPIGWITTFIPLILVYFLRVRKKYPVKPEA